MTEIEKVKRIKEGWASLRALTEKSDEIVERCNAIDIVQNMTIKHYNEHTEMIEKMMTVLTKMMNEDKEKRDGGGFGKKLKTGEEE